MDFVRFDYIFFYFNDAFSYRYFIVSSVNFVYYDIIIRRELADDINGNFSQIYDFLNSITSRKIKCSKRLNVLFFSRYFIVVYIAGVGVVAV